MIGLSGVSEKILEDYVFISYNTRYNRLIIPPFCRFINQALAEELDKFPTIKDPDHEIAFQLFAKGYQLLEPSIKERDAVYESLTYSSELYVSARLIFGFDVQ